MHLNYNYYLCVKVINDWGHALPTTVQQKGGCSYILYCQDVVVENFTPFCEICKENQI